MTAVKPWQDISIMELIPYLYHKVSVLTQDDREFVGWVYTIDPVTKSIVLYLNGCITTVMGHSVMSVSYLEGATMEVKHFLNSLFKMNSTCDKDYLLKRKSDLVKWLKNNRFPVDIIGDQIRVANVLDILPPYNSNSCRTSNEIMLGRIQKLIEAMPQ